MAIFRVRPSGLSYPEGLTLQATSTTINSISNSAQSVIAISNTGTGLSTYFTNGNTVHVFTEGGIFRPSFTGNVEILVVAGGGAGGGSNGTIGILLAGAGGGAGGVINSSSYPVTQNVNYGIQVGIGGHVTSTINTSSYIATGNGQPSFFGTAVAYGGGQGGGPGSPISAYGQSGGSGGGGPVAGAGISGQGYAGAGGVSTPPGGVTYYGGGGGARGAGALYSVPCSGGTYNWGGVGLFSYITGANTHYGYGGQGGTQVGSTDMRSFRTITNKCGTGAGGSGASAYFLNCTWTPMSAHDGAPGIVIVRYRTVNQNTTSNTYIIN